MHTTRRFRQAAGLLILGLATGLAAACGRDAGEEAGAGAPGDVSLRIMADSVIAMTPLEGTGTMECRLTLVAVADGPDGGRAAIRGGQIQYYWWASGVEAGTVDLARQDIVRMWGDTLVQVGFPRNAHPHGYGQGQPVQPVRGEAWLEYAPAPGAESRRTDTFRFYCYEPQN